VTFPEGLLDFVLLNCDGTPVTFTVSYPEPLPNGFVYWKYGPTPSQPLAHWYPLPVTPGSTTVTFTITDGGQGDDDVTVNGMILDAGGPGTAGVNVPTLSEPMLMLPALLLVGLGMSRLLGHR